MVTSAIGIPNGKALRATGVIPGGNLSNNDTLSFGGWLKVDSFVDQYMACMVFQKQANPGETGSYFYYGIDSQAGGGPGMRGFSYYMGVGSGLGGHAITTVTTLGTWNHWCATKLGPGGDWTFYTNGIPQVFDSGPGTVISLNFSLDELDTTVMFTELDFGPNGFNGAARANFVCSKALSQAEVQTIMTQSIPGVGISGFGGLGVWPLTGASDFAATTGPNASEYGPGSFTTTTGPSNIIDGGSVILSPRVKRRSRGFFC